MKKIFMAVIALIMTLSASAQFYIYFSDGTVAKVDSISMVAPEGAETPETPDTPTEPEEPSAGIGVFSVSTDKQVSFSKGNLQYTESTNTWAFAENQWDYIGTDNITGGSVSSAPKKGNSKEGYALADKIDLFGWSTSSTYFGISTSTDWENNYSGSFVDWGINQIGNDAPNIWRTLTSDEWEYLLNTRNNASLLKGVAQVNGVNGLVLLPDDYNWIATDRIIFKSGFTTSANSNVEGYGQYQTFTVDQWSKLEAAGAVFLPATGYRDGSGVYYVQLNGCYWSATEYYNNYAHSLDFYSDVARMSNYRGRYYGLSIRLVKDIERETTTPEEPEDDPQDSNCNQTVMVKGAIKEIYERKEWYNSEDTDLGFYAVADTRNAMMSRVNLEVTFINTEYANDTIVYNITTDADGEFNLNAKLYDTWDVYKTTVTVEAKSYLTSMAHYYEKWDNDDSKWKQSAQEVRGYYQRNSTQKTLSEDALLIGEAISDILLTFVPDRYENTIRGISYYNSYTGMYYDEQVGGVDTFRSWNPLGW